MQSVIGLITIVDETKTREKTQNWTVFLGRWQQTASACMQFTHKIPFDAEFLFWNVKIINNIYDAMAKTAAATTMVVWKRLSSVKRKQKRTTPHRTPNEAHKIIWPSAKWLAGWLPLCGDGRQIFFLVYYDFFIFLELMVVHTRNVASTHNHRTHIHTRAHAECTKCWKFISIFRFAHLPHDWEFYFY